MQDDLTRGKKISKALKGRTFSEESRAKMSAAKMGKPRDAATRAKIGAARRGIPRDDATRKAISDGLKRTHEVRRQVKAATTWKHPRNP